jgi:hypothetical protein
MSFFSELFTKFRTNNTTINSDDYDDEEQNEITIDKELNITTSKFNDKITVKNNDSNEEETSNEEEISNEEETNYEEISNYEESSIEEEVNEEINEDKFDNYIIESSKQKYTKNSYFLKFSWNGIDFLDRWELQRKVDLKHATELARSIRNDYKKYGEFIPYDPIHLGKIDGDDKYYVLDGQHRLEAYYCLFKKNRYPIQQIPAILWHVKNQEEFIDIFHKINDRITIDKLKLVQVKLLEIIDGMENKYGKNIWGSKRPKINKDIFVDKLKNMETIHDLQSEDILNKLFKINDEIRKQPRNSRTKPLCSISVHKSAEDINFFLGLDKNMLWINNI